MATPRRRKPEVTDKDLLNLVQTSGVEVTVSVSTFVQRLRQLEKDGGAGGPEALALLKTRGLTDDVLKEAELLLKKFGSVTFAPAASLDPEQEQAIRQKAEDELWGWYMEWSTIAQNAISNGRLLLMLGYGNGGKSAKDATEDDLPPPTTTTQLTTRPVTPG